MLAPLQGGPTPIRRTRDAIDLVAATIDAPARIVEHTIFGEDLIDGRASAHGIVFTEDFMKIAGQQDLGSAVISSS